MWTVALVALYVIALIPTGIRGGGWCRLALPGRVNAYATRSAACARSSDSLNPTTMVKTFFEPFPVELMKNPRTVGGVVSGPGGNPRELRG